MKQIFSYLYITRITSQITNFWYELLIASISARVKIVDSYVTNINTCIDIVQLDMIMNKNDDKIGEIVLWICNEWWDRCLPWLKVNRERIWNFWIWRMMRMNASCLFWNQVALGGRRWLLLYRMWNVRVWFVWEKFLENRTLNQSSTRGILYGPWAVLFYCLVLGEINHRLFNAPFELFVTPAKF